MLDGIDDETFMNIMQMHLIKYSQGRRQENTGCMMKKTQVKYWRYN
jgi:hypothetical protein